MHAHLAAVLLANSALAPSDVLLLTSEPSGFGVAAALRVGQPELVPLPFTTRSERVARAVPGARGLGLRLQPLAGEVVVAELAALAVRHDPEEEILIADGALRLVGPPVLARAIRSRGRNVLAELARCDAVLLDDELVVALPAGRPAELELFAIAAEAADAGQRGLVVASWEAAGERETQERELLPGPRHAARLVLPAEAELVHLRIAGPLGLDQVFLARSSPVALEEARPLERIAAHAHAAPEARPWRRGGRGPRFEIAVPAAETEPGAQTDGATSNRIAAGQVLEAWFELPDGVGAGPGCTVLARVALEPAANGAAGEPAAVSASARRDTPSAAGLFLDIAAEVGVATSHLEGPDEQLDIRPTMGPGVAWGDVDGDGWVDLYVVQGRGRAGSEPPQDRLFLNAGGRFTDATDASGVRDEGAGMGALLFDAEGDGDLDLYVANYGSDALHRNDGQGVFADVSQAAGVGAEDLWGAGVAAADADLDGDLDVYVPSYLRYDESRVPPADQLDRYQREDPILMLPFVFPGDRSLFLRNDCVARDGSAPLRFTDVAEELGMQDPAGRGMQALFWDFDQDGDQDLYKANDLTGNVLWRNEGDGRFRDVSFGTGTDDPRGSMGLAVGDIENDGDEDLLVTNWQLETSALFQNNLLSHTSPRRHQPTFRDVIVRSGLGPACIGVTKWGVELFDPDNDGDLDVFVANGYTGPDYESTGICVGQPSQFFRNVGDGRFEDASAWAGEDVVAELAHRSAVACDYDQDGGLDVVVTANNGPLQLLRNVAAERGHWLGVRLRSDSANPFAIGAAVEVRAGGRNLLRTLRAGTSYLGGNAPELHFGLGSAQRVEGLKVNWPSGRVSEHAVELVDAFVTLEEPR